MAQVQPPQVPQKKGLKNSAVIAICACIGVGTIACSGAASYYAAKAGTSAAQGSISSGMQIAEQVQNNGSASIQVLDVKDIVKQLRPSVVEIQTEVMTNGNSIFGQYYSQGAGSGVILSADGYIVTNNHVVEDANSITIKTLDGTEYPAELIGTDAQTDVAVLKVDAHDLTPAVIGDSNAIEVGQAAIAIGNPLGSLGGTVTTGIISAVGREITIDNETMTLLQTDAAINPGNSGGGLFDINGQLIGIVNAKTSDTGIEGLGFAIPISDVLSVIEDLEAHGKVTTRPVLNVSLQDISDSTFFGQNRDLEPGVYIVQVIEGGTAAEAGLQEGDRILSFDGQDVSTAAEVKSILKKHVIGDQVEIIVERNGEPLTMTLNLKGSNS